MKYKAIFFDWDGTAVLSRTAPTEVVRECMIPLLREGKKLIIVSGTTYENIAEGKLHELLPKDCLNNLYLGLGRGAYNYGFKDGQPVILQENMPNLEELMKIHRASYRLHEELLVKYDICTDIVFNRPNYCKVDLMAAHVRGGKLFLQQEEIDQVKEILTEGGLTGGLLEVLALSEKLGEEEGIKLKATTDAKYVEVGISTKSDNVNYFMDHVLTDFGISAEDCCFWGDEYCYLTEGVSGSDAYMITDMTREGDFFDVSKENRTLPAEVKWLGGGIETFHEFLREA